MKIYIKNWIQNKEREIYILAIVGEKKSKDIGNIRCIKSGNRDDEIKGRCS